MSEDDSLSPQAVVVSEVLLLGGALVAGYHFWFPPVLPLEAIFPAHILYYLLSYNNKYPLSGLGRKFGIGWFLVFGDMLAQTILLGQDLPASWTFLQVEFLLLFVLMQLISPRELRKEMENAGFRGLLFLIESVYKSSALVKTFQETLGMFEGKFTYRSTSFAVIVGSCRLACPAVVHTVDQLLFCVSVDYDVLLRYLRVAPLISGGILTLLYSAWPSNPEKSQDTVYTHAHLAVNLAFLVWYGNDAISYGGRERRKET